MSDLPANVIDKIIKDYFAAAMQEVREIVKDGVGGPNPGIDVAQELVGTDKFLKSLKSELASRNFQLGTIGIAENATENTGYPFPKKERTVLMIFAREFFGPKLNRAVYIRQC